MEKWCEFNTWQNRKTMIFSTIIILPDNGLVFFFLMRVTVLSRNLFSIANDCFVNISDLSKVFVKKQLKYLYVPYW